MTQQSQHWGGSVCRTPGRICKTQVKMKRKLLNSPFETGMVINDERAGKRSVRALEKNRIGWMTAILLRINALQTNTERGTTCALQRFSLLPHSALPEGKANERRVIIQCLHIDGRCQG